MPLTSSVLPVPRAPSRPITSPASSVAPSRRPSARVSSTDSVLTEVLIAGLLETFDPGAIAEANPWAPFDLPHPAQRNLDSFQGALRDPHAGARSRAEQLEILGLRNRERPLFASQA